jgi:hypothetical protein
MEMSTKRLSKNVDRLPSKKRTLSRLERRISKVEQKLYKRLAELQEEIKNVEEQTEHTERLVDEFMNYMGVPVERPGETWNIQPSLFLMDLLKGVGSFNFVVAVDGKADNASVINVTALPLSETAKQKVKEYLGEESHANLNIAELPDFQK